MACLPGSLPLIGLERAILLPGTYATSSPVFRPRSLELRGRHYDLLWFNAGDEWHRPYLGVPLMNAIRLLCLAVLLAIAVACPGANARSYNIEGPDFVGTDPGNTYRAHGDMRHQAIISAHAGAIVYAESGSRVSADGGTIYVSGGAVDAFGDAVVYYTKDYPPTLRDRAQGYLCPDTTFTNCRRVR
jgi:hypothetical protein